jgi:hypothetical protein
MRFVDLLNQLPRLFSFAVLLCINVQPQVKHFALPLQSAVLYINSGHSPWTFRWDVKALNWLHMAFRNL